jgi:hypothetical protein
MQPIELKIDKGRLERIDIRFLTGTDEYQVNSFYADIDLFASGKKISLVTVWGDEGYSQHFDEATINEAQLLIAQLAGLLETSAAVVINGWQKRLPAKGSKDRYAKEA